MSNKPSANDWRLWRDFLFVTSHLNSTLDTQLQQNWGLSLSDFDVLATLNRSSAGCLPVSELRESVLVSKSGLSRAISRLERQGWVQKDVAEDDRRRQIITLTSTGSERLDAAAQDHILLVEEIFFNAINRDNRKKLAEITSQLKTHLKNN